MVNRHTGSAIIRINLDTRLRGYDGNGKDAMNMVVPSPKNGWNDLNGWNGWNWNGWNVFGS